MGAEAPPPPAAPAAAPQPLTTGAILVLAAALAGSLLVTVSGQFTTTAIADIQGSIGASADEGSWLAIGYVMALFCGLVCSAPLIGAFGLGRCTVAGGLAIAATALACGAAPPLPFMIALRALQGFAAGWFGPMAFVATFITARGPRLPFGLALLALNLLLPTTLGPVAAALVEDRLGWQALFYVQAAIGALLAVAGILLMPRAPIGWPALRKDWTALFLLAAALAASILVLGQGTRRYWLDSPVILWSLAACAAAWGGFLVTAIRSPAPVIDARLLVRRGFAGPITLNLLFRAGFAGTAFLVPQFLVAIQGYRPLELAGLFAWAAIPQLLVFPVTWWLLQRLDGRVVAGFGLLLFGAGILLASSATGLVAADQLRPAMALAGAGQVLFLVPNLVAGGSSLTLPDGPTASLLFNATTVGGTSLGVAATTELVTERQKFHAGALAESAVAYGGRPELPETLSAVLAGRTPDDAVTAARAVATIAGALRREAWVLAFNDGFLLVGAVLVASAAGLLFLQRQPPLGGARS